MRLGCLNEGFGFSKELDFQVLGNFQFLASIVGLAKDQGFFLNPYLFWVSHLVGTAKKLKAPYNL